jgi:glycosyltransferase involved in cell wall biosynthesis
MTDKEGFTPKRFLVCSGVRGDTRRYRSVHLYEQLCLLESDCRLARLVDFDLARTIDRPWDIVFFHRVAYDGYVGRLVDLAHRRGARVVFDCDDLIFDPAAFQWINSPEFADKVRSTLFRQNMERIRLTLNACDAATASTDFLAEQVRALGKPAWVHRNAFSLEMLACSEQAYLARASHPQRVVIGYASGTPTHNRDFELAKPALKQVLARYPQSELWLIGPLDPGSDWGSLAERIRHFDLAPLVTGNPFSQSKSEIKYMEAGLVRVPTVASPTEAFVYAIRPGENGFLAGSDEEWIAALSQLMEDVDLRARIGAQAYADVLVRYSPACRAGTLAGMLNEISQQLTRPESGGLTRPESGGLTRPESDELKGKPVWKNLPSLEDLSQKSSSFSLQNNAIAQNLAKDPSNFRLGLYSLLHNGPRLLLRQMWVFFRRLLAPVFPFQKK